MNCFTNQEYLDLVRKLADQQYDDAIDDYDIEEMEWISSEPIDIEVEEKICVNTNGIIDLTNIKSDQIMAELFKCTNLKVDNFKLQTGRYTGAPNQKGPQTTMDVKVWETRVRTPSGFPCNIDYPVIFDKDSRFVGRSWLKYFDIGNEAHNVPAEVVVDIVRWLQVLKKLTAFL